VSELIVFTRDARVDLYNDAGVHAGWDFTPVPPDSSGEWFIADTSKDYKTGWVKYAKENDYLNELFETCARKEVPDQIKKRVREQHKQLIERLDKDPKSNIRKL
jgi:hypothetical protein